MNPCLRRHHRPLCILLAVLAAGLLAPRLARAAQFLGDEAEAVVKAGTTVDGNLYASGQTVRVEGTVDGDLICAGSQIIVAEGGEVTGDLICAGQSVEISGTVDGDVRAAGYLVRVNSGGSVGGELVGAAFAIEVEPDASVGDDLMAAGSQVRVAGTVGGNARVAAGGLDIQGDIDGDVDASVGNASDAMPAGMMPWGNQVQRMPAAVPGGLHLDDGASIGGDLDYSSAAEFDLPAGAVSGKVAHEVVTATEGVETTTPERPWPLRWLLALLRRALVLFVIGALLLWLAPRLVEAGRGLLAGEALAGLGWGCGTMFGAAVLLIGLVIATILGLILFSALTLGEFSGLVFAISAVLGTLLTFGLYLVAWTGQAVVADAVGRRILRSADGGIGARLAALGLGALLLALVLTLPVPFLGGLVRLLATGLGLGIMLLALRRQLAQPGSGMASGMAATFPATPA